MMVMMVVTTGSGFNDALGGGVAGNGFQELDRWKWNSTN